MTAAPTDDELLAFADSLLADLGDQLREPAVLAESIRDHRAFWATLFEVSRRVEDSEERTDQEPITQKN